MSEIKEKSSDQVSAEAAVEDHRRELGPFVVAAETTRMAMAFTDAKHASNPIIFANDSFLKLTGFDRAELLGQSLNSLLSRGSDPDAVSQINAALAHSTNEDPEIHYHRKDGSELWASVFISPVRDQTGEVVQHFISLMDLTKHKQAHAQSQMLIDELNHRVKNTLATMQSIVWQAVRKSTDGRAVGESIQSRLAALSRSHDLLTREAWGRAGLRDIVINALEPFMVSGALAERLVIVGDNVRLSPRASLALSVAFNELGTNAVKYGAFSNEAGSIQVTWTIEPASTGEQITLHWKENGGPPAAAPSHKGFGSQVVERGLAQELGGSAHLDFQSSGLVYLLSFPLERGVGGG